MFVLIVFNAIRILDAHVNKKVSQNKKLKYTFTIIKFVCYYKVLRGLGWSKF